MSKLTDDRKRFFAVLRREFAPRLRQVGFTGSGQNFRRSTGEVIHAINLQSNKYGGSCALNAGVHLVFLPISWSGLPADVRTIRESDCEFRCRITPSASDYWWPYGSTERESVANARHLIDRHFSVGEAYFSKYKSSDDFVSAWPFVALEKGASASDFAGTSTRLALILARIHRHRGDHALARKFARWGLANLGNASALHDDLAAIADD
jgi:hypothetical protein